MIEVGNKAPDFSLPDQKGVTHSLHDYLGSLVLIYFYPKDDTPGCTQEACSFRDSFALYQKAGVKVLGISKDTSRSHAKFSEKFSLPFILLSDVSKSVADSYGALQLKKFMGKEYMGVMRYSYLIDRKGDIAKIYTSVDVKNHAEEVLAEISQANL